ncbi:MAG: hypothetical protein AABX10_04050 [Nanoarchaeota archaeon]
MVKNKKTNKVKSELKNSGKKSFGSKPLVWVVLGVLLLVVIVMLVRKDGSNSGYVSNELQALADNCVFYVKNVYRAEFCGYNLINGDLVNCRDSRIIDILTSQGIDTSFSSLNCRNIDIYTFRKDACLGLPVDTKIADKTCADYQ